jgi:hypothetical protein
MHPNENRVYMTSAYGHVPMTAAPSFRDDLDAIGPTPPSRMAAPCATWTTSAAMRPLARSGDPATSARGRNHGQPARHTQCSPRIPMSSTDSEGADVSQRQQTLVIVGAGLAGAKAAEALRAQGLEGRVLLYGDERERPYDRPPLSKGFLQGTKSRDEIFIHPRDWYFDNMSSCRSTPESRAWTVRRTRWLPSMARGSSATSSCSPRAHRRDGSRSPAATSTARSTCASSPMPRHYRSPSHAPRASRS